MGNRFRSERGTGYCSSWSDLGMQNFYGRRNSRVPPSPSLSIGLSLHPDRGRWDRVCRAAVEECSVRRFLELSRNYGFPAYARNRNADGRNGRRNAKRNKRIRGWWYKLKNCALVPSNNFERSIWNHIERGEVWLDFRKTRDDLIRMTFDREI